MLLMRSPTFVNKYVREGTSMLIRVKEGNKVDISAFDIFAWTVGKTDPKPK